jgi:hypothetical protein
MPYQNIWNPVGPRPFGFPRRAANCGTFSDFSWYRSADAERSQVINNRHLGKNVDFDMASQDENLSGIFVKSN